MFEKPETINDQIATYSANEKRLFVITDNENNVIMSGNEVLDYMSEMYGCYKTRSWLHSLWTVYKSTHYADFLRAWDAWNANYNPLENYNGDETNVYLTNDGAETETTTHGKSTTTTANNVTNTAYSTTYDSDVEKETDKNVQSGSTTAADSGTTSVTRDRNTKNLTVGNTTYTADNVHAEIKNRHGNLGITTSQQMITSEIDMRMKPLIQMFIDVFISDYAYYITDTWGCDYDC